MPTERTPEEIAKGLTKAQRDQVSIMGALLWESPDWNASTSAALERKGLVKFSFYRLGLTDLGRAVAALLAQPAPSETEGRE